LVLVTVGAHTADAFHNSSMYSDLESLVIEEFIPLVAALSFAAAIYVARERRLRRGRIQPARPDITMRDVCADPALLAIEGACLAADDPRIQFRRAAIDNALAAIYLEIVAEYGAPDTQPMLAACTRAWQALREYLRLKYDDAVADDWFDHFVAVARPYLREKVRLTREFALHLDEGTERFARIYDELLRGLAQDALAAPQKKTFVPPDFSHS
jgi:hypothetical protein